MAASNKEAAQQKWMTESHWFSQSIGDQPTGLMKQMTGNDAKDDNIVLRKSFIKAMDEWSGTGEKPKLARWLTPKELKAL